MPLSLVLVLAASSCITQGFIVASTSLDAKIVWLTWHYVVSGLMPIVWLSLVRAVTGLPVKIPNGVEKFLVGFTVMSTVIIVTNSAHHLIFANLMLQPGRMLLNIEYGSFFNVFAVVSYTEFLVSMVFLIRRWQLERGARRTEMLLWLSCVLLPTVPDIVTFIDPNIFFDIEPAPLILAVTSMLAAWGLASRRVFRIEPVALEVVFESLRDGVLILDRFGRVAQLNSAAKSFARANLNDAIGVPIEDVLIGWTLHALRALEPQTQEINLPNTKKYLEYSLSSLVIGGFVVIVRDVSEVRLYQRSLLEQNLRDPLTGLANRRAFFERATPALLQSSHENPVFVAYLDLDDFKSVNDRFGHEQGDNLLRAVSERIKTITASNGLVARVGGDEFVILFEQVTHEKVVAIVTDIEHALTQSFPLMSEHVTVGVSIGLAQSPLDGTEVVALLDAADSKMYKNKQLRNVQRESRNVLQN